MVTLLANVNFWSLREDIIVKDADIGVHRYQDKNNISKERVYYNCRKKYIESRGGILEPKNNRPTRLKDSLKEFEEILAKVKLISEGWKTGNVYQLFFCSGLAVYLTVSSKGDVASMVFDRFLCGKLLSENVVDVASSSSYLVYSYNDTNLSIIHATKPIIPLGSKIPYRFSAFEPKIGSCDGIGPAGRRFERKLSINLTEKMILVWWETGEDEVYPWSPINKDRDRANLLVYQLNGTAVDLLCYCRTELSPLTVTFSRVCENVILTVEQGFDSVGGVNVLSCVYEVDKGTLHRVTVTSIPLEAPLTAHAHNPSETCLLLACNNGILALHCEARGMTHVTKAGLIPSRIAWLHSGTMVALVNDRGQIQCFDLALSLIRAQFVLEESIPQRILDMGEYFRHLPSLRNMKWANQTPARYSLRRPAVNVGMAHELPFLLLHFANGPLACIRIIPCNLMETTWPSVRSLPPLTLAPDVLSRQYIKHNQWDEAINLLVSLNWETEGRCALKCLFAIVNSLLKLPLSTQRESQIEAALSSFILSPVRFGQSVEDEYGPAVRSLTRRFFFKLLRSGSLEKSYRLAIDLKDRDCFLHVHHVARCHGNKELASLALKSARELHSDSCWSGSCSAISESGSCSENSSQSYSGSSCSTCSYSEESGELGEPPKQGQSYEEQLHKVDDSDLKAENIRLHSKEHSQSPQEYPPPLSKPPKHGGGKISINIGPDSPQTPQFGSPYSKVIPPSIPPLSTSLPPTSTPRLFNSQLPHNPTSRFLGAKKDVYSPNAKSGANLPVRLKTVREVCELSNVSSDSNDEVQSNNLFEVAVEKRSLAKQYERAVFQEVTTEDDEGGTVKVVHFGVV